MNREGTGVKRRRVNEVPLAKFEAIRCRISIELLKRKSAFDSGSRS